MSSRTNTDDISTRDQDVFWPAPKLIVIGFITLMLALAVIYAAASIIGE